MRSRRFRATGHPFGSFTAVRYFDKAAAAGDLIIQRCLGIPAARFLSMGSRSSSLRPSWTAQWGPSHPSSRTLDGPSKTARPTWHQSYSRALGAVLDPSRAVSSPELVSPTTLPGRSPSAPTLSTSVTQGASLALRRQPSGAVSSLHVVRKLSEHVALAAQGRRARLGYREPSFGTLMVLLVPCGSHTALYAIVPAQAARPPLHACKLYGQEGIVAGYEAVMLDLGSNRYVHFGRCV